MGEAGLLDSLSVDVVHATANCSDNVRVHLDTPKSTSPTRVSSGRLQIQGWVHPLYGAGARVLVRTGGVVRRYDLNEERPDVIKAILGENPHGHANSRCGFNFEIVATGLPVEIGLEISKVEQWTWLIGVRPPQKVIDGTEGWLFLDNDSNASVDQYTGVRLLSDDELKRWDAYFESISARTCGAPPECVFVLAPNKEYIFPDRFPKQRAPLTPLDQFLNRYGDSQSILWPLEPFVAERDLVYWKGDTHWTDYGAAIAAEVILKRFDRKFDGILEAQSFTCSKRTGDLGGKCIPKRINSVFEAAAGFLTEDLVFDNGVHNHGRIRCYKKASAKGEGVCLVMGDSFSVNLVPWLAKAFSEVIFVHTAAAYDPELVRLVNPTHLILQSNSRFIINPPDAEFSFWSMLRMKLAIPDAVSALARSSFTRTESKSDSIEQAFNEFAAKIRDS